eukprot:Opistho-2@77710
MPLGRNQHIWIVGASSGIGKELARQYAAANEGHRISLSARRVEQLEGLANELKEMYNCDVAFSPCDVRDRNSISECHAKVVNSFGPVDVLIANAGVNQAGKMASQLTLDDVERVVETNFTGAIMCVLAVLPSMQERNSGTIVGISSLAGYRGLPGCSVYGATKTALSYFLESLRIEVHWSTNIRVVDVCPGFVDTEMLRNTSDEFDIPSFAIVPCDKACRGIITAIARQQRHYGFPWYFEYGLMVLARYLPAFAYEWIVSRAPKSNDPAKNK